MVLMSDVRLPYTYTMPEAKPKPSTATPAVQRAHRNWKMWPTCGPIAWGLRCENFPIHTASIENQPRHAWKTIWKIAYFDCERGPGARAVGFRTVTMILLGGFAAIFCTCSGHRLSSLGRIRARETLHLNSLACGLAWSFHFSKHSNSY